MQTAQLNQEKPAEPIPREFSFGPFRYLPARQLLLIGDDPVRLGSRARDILFALLEHAGEVVTKQDLIARVWPGAFVEEANLRVHVAALRKVLADDRGAAGRYITNVSGRGYCFVAPVAKISESGSTGPPAASPAEPIADQPPPASRIVGRSEVIRSIAARVCEQPLVTVIGPGGIGKTTVVLAVADALFATFKDGIRFVDLSLLTDPLLVPTALAAALGIGVLSEQPIRSLASWLADKHLLIVLDNCEHVVDAAALLAEEILRAAPGLHILATSREALGVSGEGVQRLAPLAGPPLSGNLTAAEALAFPAVELFVTRAAARMGSFELTDGDVPFVSEICARLDGLALAIEIAAGRVDAFGVAGLASALDDRFRLFMRGRRTARPRHQTLSTTLDWSYVLLPEQERAVLRRLTVFAGIFTMASAIGVVADENIQREDVVECVVNLIGKSLVTAIVDGGVADYRLLDMTRAYARLKLEESGERSELARRHAVHHRDLLEGARQAWETQPAAEWLEGHRHLIDDVRAALDWSFSPTGDAAIGIALAVAAVPLWFQMGLISECRERVERARAEVPEQGGGADAMRLDAALAWSLMQTRGFVAETKAAWALVLERAEALGDVDYQLRGLWGLWAGRQNDGDLRGALTLAHRFHDLAAQQVDRADFFVGDRMVGYTLHLLGDQGAARRYLERMLAGYPVPVTGARIIRFIFDQRLTARCFLARILWLQGFPDQAMRTVDTIVEAAAATQDALTLCQVLVQAACPLALLAGGFDAADRFVTMLTDYSARHGLRFWQTWGGAFRGLLLIQRGDAAGLMHLDAAIAEFRGIDYGIYFTAFLGALAEGLGKAGQVDEALTVIDQALERSDSNDERWCIADLLRVKGELLWQRGAAGATAQAELHFLRALDWARQQQVLAWELRVATSLARLWRHEQRLEAARNLLTSSYSRFTEGFATADLVATKQLLDELS